MEHTSGKPLSVMRVQSTAHGDLWIRDDWKVIKWCYDLVLVLSTGGLAEYSFTVSFFCCTVIGTDGERGFVDFVFFINTNQCYIFIGKSHLVETAVSE